MFVDGRYFGAEDFSNLFLCKPYSILVELHFNFSTPIRSLINLYLIHNYLLLLLACQSANLMLLSISSQPGV